MLRLVGIPLQMLRATRGCVMAVLFFLLLLFLVLCGSAAFAVGRASAATPPLDVCLLVDQSNSVWHRSDPTGLRVEAAALVLDQLGVDEQRSVRACVIAFGTEVVQHASFTLLQDAASRARLTGALRADVPRGWTDTEAALRAARGLFRTESNSDHTRVLLLLTDGQPEVEGAQYGAEAEAYQVQVQQRIRTLVDDGIQLHVVLLAAESESLETVLPWWRASAENIPELHLYEAQHPSQLPRLYHSIAATLRGAESAGAVQATVVGHGEQSVQVGGGLAEVTLLVQKSDPALQVNIGDPTGRSLSDGDPDVQVRRDGRVERWTIRDPLPGSWQVWLDGAGEVTVWQEVRRATSAPVPALTFSPTRTSLLTPHPTMTGIPVAVVPPADPPRSDSPAASTRPPLLPRLLGSLLLSLAVGSALIWSAGRLRRSAPLLDGTLRVLEGPGGPGTRWQLEQPEIALGGMGSTVGLGEGGTVHARLVAKWDNGEMVPLLVPHESVRLNGRALTEPRPLWDRDEIELGDIRLRYENVRRRRPAHTTVRRGASAR